MRHCLDCSSVLSTISDELDAAGQEQATTLTTRSGGLVVDGELPGGPAYHIQRSADHRAVGFAYGKPLRGDRVFSPATAHRYPATTRLTARGLDCAA